MKRDASEGETRQEHNPVKAPSEEAAKLASMLAPPEEQPPAKDLAVANANNNGGTIVVDTSQLHVPKDFIDEAERENPFGLEPIVIFLLLLVLAFISFIAYLIHLEPTR